MPRLRAFAQPRPALVELRVDRPRRLGRQGPGRPSSSSGDAARNRSAEPKCCSSARRRAGPTPGRSSRIDPNAFVSRRWRWKPTAKRCASSRSRCRSCSPGLDGSSRDRSAGPDEDLLHPLRQRDHRHARQVELLHRRQRRGQLALPRRPRRGSAPREALVVVLRHRGSREAAKRREDHLGHRREVVLAVQPAHANLR